ncbi:Wall-associated receptor kinase-like 14 [Linum perenne]
MMIVPSQSRILPLLILAISILYSQIRVLQAAAAAELTICSQFCGGGGRQRVPYPFGFSSGCPIQLNCTEQTGGIHIGEFRVQNFSSEGEVLVGVPAKCNRPIESLSSLFGSNFAPSRRTSLLLQNCSREPSTGGRACEIQTSSIQRGLNITGGCDLSSDNLTCFSSENNGSVVMSHREVREIPCKFVFSSMAVDDTSGRVDDPVVSLELQRVELEWWLDGSCAVNGSRSCSRLADCKDVKIDHGGGRRQGFRCRCREGLVGDGYNGGGGCRRAPNCNPSKYMSGKCGGTTRIGVLIGGLVAGAALMAGAAILCYCITRRSTTLRHRWSARRLLTEAAGNSSVPFYAYKEIEKATNGFSEKQRLGTGAYGTVYSGKLDHNDECVAIKKIRHNDPESIDQVMNEIKLLSSVSHPNLVRLLGCCIEEGEQILVYEFMPNGTLCQHLQRENGKETLPWSVRLTVATETANAISYLHSMNPPIYHRDIKSSNILLDYNFKSKVADFGLSRLGMTTESSHISTAPQGTPGYLDPQYHQYFHLSDKSDVYSFGVVLLEIITGLKVVDFSRPHSEVNLAALAVDRIGRGCVDEVIDPYLEPNRDAWTLSSIHNVAELAFRCLAFHGDMRPTMTEVAQELENIRLSGWIPNMFMESPGSSDEEDDDGSVKGSVGSKRLIVPERNMERLTSLEVVKEKDSSPVSVRDPWFSEQSSPSSNSLLSNAV